MAELRTLEAMAVQGALKAMAELGALGTMAELGALGTMAELGALEAMADGLRGPRPRPPRPGPYSQNPTTPPPKISMGKWGGIRSPPGLNRQDSTKHDRTALQGQTDRTVQNTTGQPSWARQTGRQESPPGPDRQDRTWWQGSPPGPDRQDIPQEPEALQG